MAEKAKAFDAENVVTVSVSDNTEYSCASVVEAGDNSNEPQSSCGTNESHDSEANNEGHEAPSITGSVDTQPTKVEPLKSLSAFEAGLALLSAIVGGGIVGIPYAMFHTGIPLGVLLNLAVAFAGWYTGKLYLKVKDMSPTYVESMYELGFVTMGVHSIYLISSLILISGIGCTMIYFIVFSEISASLAKQICGKGVENVFTDTTFYIVWLGVLMTPLCLKKMLAEMKIVSIILFISIALFILLFLIQLMTLGEIENHDETFGQYYEVKFDMKLVTGFNIIVLAYAYHINLFPTFNSLGANKSNTTAMQAVAISALLSFVIYVSLGILSIYSFGSELKPSVLNNVDEEQNAYSYIIRVAFLLVLACHIPYIFFPTKESFLIIFDEAKNSSMKKTLLAKIEKQEKEGSMVPSQQPSQAATAAAECGSDEKMGYLKMPGCQYYALTLALYASCILAAILIKNIGTVFEFVGAFGISFTSFGLPGLMYLIMLRKPKAKIEIENDKQRRWNQIGAASMICLSLFNMLLVIVKQFMGESSEVAETSS